MEIYCRNLPGILSEGHQQKWTICFTEADCKICEDTKCVHNRWLELSKDRCHSNKSTFFPPASHRVRWTKDFISLCKIMFCKTQFHGIWFDFFPNIISKIRFLFYWTFSLPTSRFLCHIFSHLFHDLVPGICLFTMVTRQNIFNQLLF